MNRRQVLAGAPLLAVAGCSSVANSLATAANTAGALAISTVQQATTFWGTVKGIAQVAVAGVSIADPALGATLTAAISVGDTLLSGLSQTATDAASVTTAIATLVQHGAATLSQAGAAITAIPNGQIPPG